MYTLYTLSRIAFPIQANVDSTYIRVDMPTSNNDSPLLDTTLLCYIGWHSKLHGLTFQVISC